MTQNHHFCSRVLLLFDVISTEIPIIIDPRTTRKYPSATGSIIVGISVYVCKCKRWCLVQTSACLVCLCVCVHVYMYAHSCGYLHVRV